VAPGLSGHEWPRLPGFAERMAAAEANDTHGLALAIAHLWAPLSFEKGEKQCDAAARVILDQAEHFMSDEQEIDEPSAIPHLKDIGVPTLIVLGDRDLDAITEIGRILEQGIPGARTETLAGADHMLPLRTPDRLVELLLAHL
jgi:3-oxoadipate enol-lactonase